MSGTNLSCPHCGTERAYFELVTQLKSPTISRTWHVPAMCEVCKDLILISLQDFENRGLDPIAAAKGGQLQTVFRLTRVLPKQEEPRIAKAIPGNVEKPLLEAERAFTAGLYSAAGSCYRKAIERALKSIDPTLSGMLNKRIRKLEDEGLIPPSMVELLDQVRLFGNSAMHEDDIDPSKEDCSAAREFCHLFLTYSFTLPAKIAEAKSNAAGEDS